MDSHIVLPFLLKYMTNAEYLFEIFHCTPMFLKYLTNAEYLFEIFHCTPIFLKYMTNVEYLLSAVNMLLGMYTEDNK
jgi:hypothetical protein